MSEVSNAIANGSDPKTRGEADAYYRRASDPHVYPDSTNIGKRIPLTDPEHIAAYNEGYNEQDDFKEFI